MEKEYVYVIFHYEDQDLNHSDVVKDGCLKKFVSELYNDELLPRLAESEEDAIDVLEDEDYIVVKRPISE